MNAEAECWCGWRKEYRNGVAAQFGLEVHWQYRCPLTKGAPSEVTIPLDLWEARKKVLQTMRGHGANSGSNVLTTLTAPDPDGTWPRSQSRSAVRRGKQER